MSHLAVIAAVFAIGVYGAITCRHLIKVLIGLNLMEAAAIMLLVHTGYVPGAEAPIVTHGRPAVMVDPLPQALALTAIVIGAATTAIVLTLAIGIYRHTGTLDIRAIVRDPSSETAGGDPVV